MADLKISQLTAATTPLAGTEVLPIVQSSTTKKVATDDLTVKNIRSNATTGILQIAGPAASATRTMTVPDANFTAARTDAANSFTGDQTLTDGNLVVGTSGKGVDFSATPGTGTSELFDDYEEGTFTPTYETTGGSFSYASQLGRYTKIGRVVYCTFTISTSSATVGSGDVVIGGLPFTIENSGNARGGFGLGRSNGFTGDAPLGIIVFENANSVYLTYKATVTGDTAYLPASSLNTGSGNQIFGSFFYTTAS